jgi:hypothetical protein
VSKSTYFFNERARSREYGARPVRESNRGRNYGSPPQFAFDGAGHAALLARDEDAAGISRVVAVVSLAGIDALDRTAGELFGVIDYAAQGVAIVRVAGQSLCVQHVLAAGCSAVVRDDGGLDAGLLRRAGLALADALDLRAWKEYSFQPR